ncbi:MAG: type II toxin-antitoxin system Phd/YefM family antitoxin [Planctomycetes bacterium]|nr:type II toxin-antitoxin system Phd/YefM family antitoxin [Planctomycetota bacterium]
MIANRTFMTILLVMLTCSIADTKAHLSSCVASAESGEPVLITRHGRPVAAMISAQDWERLQAVKSHRRRGLLALVGGWEDAAEWSERVDGLVAARSPVRPLPALE